MAAFAMTSFTASAVENNGAELTFDPAPGAVLDAFPETLTITVSGPESLKIQSWGKPQIRLYDPSATESTGKQIITADNYVAGSMKLTFNLKTGSGVNRELKGTWKIELLKDKIQYVWDTADASKNTKNVAYTYEFTVGTGGGDTPENPDDPKGDAVKYDITMTGTTPKLEGFAVTGVDSPRDATEGIQFIFNCTNMKTTDQSLVTITGPGYNQTAPLFYNMGTMDGKGSNLIAKFGANFYYSGEYTLTIPKGVMGDETWFEDHEKGRANEAVEVKFNVKGHSGPVENTTFNPSKVTPTPNTEIPGMANVAITFPEKCFFTEGTTVQVNYMTNMAATSYDPFCEATIKRVSDTEVMLEFAEVAKKKNAKYQIIIPKGTFWDAAHEADKEAGAFSSELTYLWTVSGVVESVEVTGHTPASDAKVSGFSKGEGISIATSDNARVAKMVLTLTEYELDNDMAMPVTLLNEVSTTTKNDKGEICWLNEGADLKFDSKHWYEAAFTLYDAAGLEIGDGMFEFYGADTVGIEDVTIDGKAAEIFTIDGVRVNGAANELPAGLYIINGKKVIVRK